MRSLVTGATGFIGRHLVGLLEEPVVLSRDPDRARLTLGPVEAFRWEPESGPPPPESLDGVEAVFNLAGESISRRWTRKRKERIHSSRVTGTRNLVEGLCRMDEPPEVLVSGSAVGFYGDRGTEVLKEDSGPGADFLANVCQAWEREAQEAAGCGVRVITTRFGIVIGAGGGAIDRLLPIFRLGLGGPLGSGVNYWPWVSVEDVARLLLHAARTRELSGPLNVVSPAPLTNREFSRTLGRLLGRPAFLPAPRFALRVALGELSTMLLASQRAMPVAAQRSGFTFHHEELLEALEEAVLRVTKKTGEGTPK